MDQRLEIASRLLSGIICQDPRRSLGARMYEVHHCLMLADALIANAASLPSLEISTSGTILGEKENAASPANPIDPLPDLNSKIQVRRDRKAAVNDSQRPTLH